MTSHVEQQIAARIIAAEAKRRQQRQQRAEFAANRQAGLAARKAAKLQRIFCGTCAKLQHTGTYRRCPQGCGMALCRSNSRCTETHLKQCDNRAGAS